MYGCLLSHFSGLHFVFGKFLETWRACKTARRFIPLMCNSGFFWGTAWQCERAARRCKLCHSIFWVFGWMD